MHALLFLLVSLLAGVLLAGLALPVAGGAGLAVRGTVSGFDALPANLSEPPLSTNSTMLAADGTPLATFYENNRVPVTLAGIAPVMRQALVAIEDSRFYDHGGVDLRGTTRAVVNNSSGDSVQGGSTLTQQYVKRVLLETALAEGDEAAAKAAVERKGTAGYQRKLVELRYATSLEEKLSKDEILERYLNIVYFGNGTYGVEAASRRYFSKSAAQLQPQEAAMLAGMVKNPSEYDPLKRSRSTATRRNLVLDRMAELKYLTGPQTVALKRTPLGLKPGGDRSGCDLSPAPFFCDWVLQTVLNDPAFGATREERTRLLFRGGVTIQTTLDMRAQQAADKAVRARVRPSDKVASTLAMVEPGTGQIKAMAVSRDFGDGPGKTKVNLAADADRGGSGGAQPGSTFKAFLAAEALKQGFGYNYTIFSPAKLPRPMLPVATCGVPSKPAAGDPPYQPGNAEQSENGPYDMTRAMALSVNTYFIQLEEQTGLCGAVTTTEKLGLRRANGDPLQPLQSWTLGTDYVSPLSMAEAYATFAARGTHCSSIGISKLTDRTGKELPIPGANCQRVLEPEIADGVTGLLRPVLQSGTATCCALGRPAAGKTGTAVNYSAAWFVGYTPNLSTAVALWNPTPPKGGYYMRNVIIGGEYHDRVFGGTIPAPIWQQAMTAALQDTRPIPFNEAPFAVQQGTRGSGYVPPPVTTPGLTPPGQPGTVTTPGGGAITSPAQPASLRATAAQSAAARAALARLAQARTQAPPAPARRAPAPPPRPRG